MYRAKIDHEKLTSASASETFKNIPLNCASMVGVMSGRGVGGVMKQLGATDTLKTQQSLFRISPIVFTFDWLAQVARVMTNLIGTSDSGG